MADLPVQLLDAVKGNVIVQWFLVVIFLLIVGTNTATKLKGPVGAAARWFQQLGEKRVNREADERRKVRQQLLRDTRDGNIWAEQEITALNTRVEDMASAMEGLERLIRVHLGWDYDRMHQLINLGIRPGDIPTPPPLRVPWRTEPVDADELRQTTKTKTRKIPPARQS